MRDLSELTLDWIMARVDEVGDCLIWKSVCVHGTSPVLSIGYGKMYVRRALWELTRGPIPEKRLVTCTCGETLCVNPDHLKLATRRAIQVRTAASGAFSTPAIRAKVAHSRRLNSKLSQEAVEAIRESDLPCPQLARDHGISLAYVHMLRKGQFRKDFRSNWLTGLVT